MYGLQPPPKIIEVDLRGISFSRLGAAQFHFKYPQPTPALSRPFSPALPVIPRSPTSLSAASPLGVQMIY